MLKNYFRIAVRNLQRNKIFSAINILGLAIGMASALIIMLWIQNEMSYDTFHEKKDRIYEAWNNPYLNGEIFSWRNTPRILARTMEKDLPEVEQATRVENSYPHFLKVGEKSLTVPGSIVDSNFLEIFTFPLLQGDKKTVLNGIHSIVITQTLARKLFGDENAMGKLIRFEDKENFIVTGILKDLPGNTQFSFEYLMPYGYARSTGNDDSNWGNNSIHTYVLLKPNVNVSLFNEKMKKFRPRYDPSEPKWEMFVYPISRWRLYSNFKNGVEVNKGRIEYVRIFGVVAVVILLIACINFMNLSTARSEKRAKEVGIRKVVGAQKPALIAQFIGESTLLAFFAALIAFLLVAFTLPFFNQLMEEKVVFDLTNIRTLTTCIAVIAFTGLIAGSYPAFFLSSFQPVKVLKGTFKKQNALISPRKVLVVVQFTFAIILIISTIFIKQQIDFVRNREIGYDKNELVYHQFSGDIEKNYELIRNELLESGVAISVTKAMSPLSESWSNGHGQEWEGKDPNDKTIFNRYSADANLSETVGLKLVAGRDMDIRKYPTDSTAVIINESALKALKFKDPIGKTIKDIGVEWHIVGVFKDFIINSPFEPTEPMLIVGAKSFWGFNVILMKFNSRNSMSDNLTKASSIFAKYNPNFPFEYKFADEEYENKFTGAKTIGTIAAIFAALTVFIACLGLFGLAAYMTESRVKEIGVHKVLGGSVSSITFLLSKDFLKLVLIAFFFAAPIAWWAMHAWLSDFQYHVPMSWEVFVFAGILSILIALLTVSSQAIKAAIANPVKSLRSE